MTRAIDLFGSRKMDRTLIWIMIWVGALNVMVTWPNAPWNELPQPVVPVDHLEALETAPRAPEGCLP